MITSLNALSQRIFDEAVAATDADLRVRRERAAKLAMCVVTAIPEREREVGLFVFLKAVALIIFLEVDSRGKEMNDPSMSDLIANARNKILRLSA